MSAVGGGTPGRGRRRAARLALSVVALLELAGCRSRKPVESSLITPKASLSHTRVPVGSPMAVTYAWTLDPAARKLGQDLRAFVHFVDQSGVVLFADDHWPEPSASSWEPGRTYTYRRTVLVPPLPFLGPAEVRMGLEAPGGGRLGLTGEDRGLLEYRAARFDLLPESESPRLVLKDGWYPPESSAGNPYARLRWITRDAVVSFRNKRRDVLVFLGADTSHRSFAKPPTLTVRVGTEGVALPIESSDFFLKKVRFRGERLPQGRWADLHLTMDQVFVPKKLGINPDERELALRVYYVYVGERDKLPEDVQEGALEAGSLATSIATGRHQ